MEAVTAALGRAVVFSVVAPAGMVRRVRGADCIVEEEPWWASLLRAPHRAWRAEVGFGQHTEEGRMGISRGCTFRGWPTTRSATFVVDRFGTPEGGRRIYLRPKVPFG
jgi:hypothetical protein